MDLKERGIEELSSGSDKGEARIILTSGCNTILVTHPQTSAAHAV